MAAAKKLPQYIAALSANLLALPTGTMLGWSSPVILSLKNEDSTDYSFTPISESEGDWVSSMINVGGAAVCFPIGIMMDKIGRKTTMLLLVIPFTLGWLLITFASNLAMLMIGRFTIGVAGGASCVTAPVYTSEIAEDSIRGTLGSYYQLMITIGILFAYVVGSYTSVFVFNISCLCIPLIFGATFFFMPETPKFLVSKGRHEEAKKALTRLRGVNYDVDTELNILRTNTEHARDKAVSFYSTITRKTAIKAIVICYALMSCLQLSGINAVIFNTGTIFTSAGATIPAAISSIVIGVIIVVATFASSLVVDKLGRRVLLMFSTLVMGLCTTALGVYFFLRESDQHGPSSPIVEALSWLPLLSLSLFVVAFSLGLGPIPWMMPGELCLIDIKAFVASTACVLNWVLSFTVTATFSSLNKAIGSGQVFWLFAGIMLVGFLFIFFFVPETKGKSVEEIQKLLGAKQ